MCRITKCQPTTRSGTRPCCSRARRSLAASASKATRCWNTRSARPRPTKCDDEAARRRARPRLQNVTVSPTLTTPRGTSIRWNLVQHHGRRSARRCRHGALPASARQRGLCGRPRSRPFQRQRGLFRRPGRFPRARSPRASLGRRQVSARPGAGARRSRQRGRVGSAARRRQGAAAHQSSPHPNRPPPPQQTADASEASPRTLRRGRARPRRVRRRSGPPHPAAGLPTRHDHFSALAAKRRTPPAAKGRPKRKPTAQGGRARP
mmetsp:Transcript_19953/g.70952  ORF Transcript_19953/g.70952 Transcript_19953/m.70952 type:complete len:263 (-) Transcript_19953:1940-2728(-)